MTQPVLSHVRAFIFDLDGTLVDSVTGIGTAMNDALSERGWPTYPIEAYLQMVGEGVEQLARKAAPQEKDLPTLINIYRNHYAERMHRETRPYPQVDGLLSELQSRQMPLSVLSNKREDFTVALVKSLFTAFHFVAVRGERAGVPRKPHPVQALELANLMKVAPKEVAFVGDTPIDIMTAQNAGMVPVGVSWGFRGLAELQNAGVSHVLTSPLDLLPLLG